MENLKDLKLRKINLNNSKSIKKRITSGILSIIIILSLILGTIAGLLSYFSTINALELSLIETSVIAAERVSKEIQSYKNIAFEIGSIPKLSDSKVSISEKQQMIDSRCKTYGFTRGNILTTDGKSIFDGNNYSEGDYFKTAMQGISFASDPLVSKVTGKMTIVISAPIWKDGIPNTEITGVVYFIPDEDFLNIQMEKMKVGNTGSSYIINKDGLTIAHEDPSIVGVSNTIKMAETDKELSSLAEIEKAMIKGENDFGKYSYNGVKKVTGYAPIPNTDGWSISVSTTEDEFLANLKKAILFIIFTLIGFLVAGFVISSKFADSISKPVLDCAGRLKLLAEGDLQSPVPAAKYEDETGQLLNDLSETINSLNSAISETSHCLAAAAEGDLTQTIDRNYKGDFEELRGSVNHIIVSLNDTIDQINMSANQVANGSEQVSSGAQALAQGATEQSSSVEELVATIEDISLKVQASAENSVDAKNKISSVSNDIQDCNVQMQNMLEAMADINSSSSEIGKIIKTIEDIAFQTNILALNAAVEAARAGSAGKGFAVVADEVRNLANKSAEAAKDTTALIENSISYVENGSKIANETGTIMSTIVENTKVVSESIDSISENAVSQAQAIVQVQQGLDQISSVVHSNSATAEESAAASEELSAQSESLKELVNKFILMN